MLWQMFHEGNPSKCIAVSSSLLVTTAFDGDAPQSEGRAPIMFGLFGREMKYLSQKTGIISQQLCPVHDEVDAAQHSPDLEHIFGATFMWLHSATIY